MKTVDDFAFQFVTFPFQNITDLDPGSSWENLDRGQYRFQAIKFVNLVVPSPCETDPYNNNIFKIIRQVDILKLQ